jgi:hypothetical protein
VRLSYGKGDIPRLSKCERAAFVPVLLALVAFCFWVQYGYLHHKPRNVAASRVIEAGMVVGVAFAPVFFLAEQWRRRR